MSTTYRDGAHALVDVNEESAPEGEVEAAEAARPKLASDALPVYALGQPVPRDLRTADDLLANGYPVPAAPSAWLERSGPATPALPKIPLYSTAAARRSRGDTWLRPGRAVETEAGRQPLNRASARPASKGASHTALRPSQARRPSASRDPHRWLSELFHEGFVVIDTETTGLSARDEVIEIAAVASDGEVLFESRLWPRCGAVPAASTRVHGLTIADLEGAPRWPEVLDDLFGAIAGHRVLAWNAPFDERLSVQSSRAWGVAHPLPSFECAMRAYAYGRGIGTGSFKLERAASVEGVLVAEQTHRSADDAKLTLAVLRSLHRRSGSRA